MTFTVPDTNPMPPLEDNAPPVASRQRPDPDALRAQFQTELADAEKELTRNQKALEAAEAKAADLRYDVALFQKKVASRAKQAGEFDRLMAKAAK